jgi:hypothetical protein
VWAGIWFLAVASALAYASIVWWGHAEVERMRDPMVFPVLWNFYYALLALVTGGMAAALTVADQVHALTPLFWAAWGIYGIVGWFVWRALINWWGRITLRSSVGGR